MLQKIRKKRIPLISSMKNQRNCKVKLRLALEVSHQQTSVSYFLTSSFFIIIIYMNCFCSTDNITSMTRLPVWSSIVNNNISIIDLETKQEIANFDGVKLKKIDSILQLFSSDSNLSSIH